MKVRVCEQDVRARAYLAVAACAIGATLLFARSLGGLVRHAASEELLSYIPLVPCVAGYLAIQRRSLFPARALPSRRAAVAVGAIGIASGISGYLLSQRLGLNDSLALTTLSYLLTLLAGALLFLGASWVKATAFPLGFLAFMIPLPEAAVAELERLLVLASADTSAWLFGVTGVPLLRDGMTLHLPGISLQVAQECSGIRSTWILVITSVLASHLFLQRWWTRALLVALVLPLGIIRNGVRILTIGLLCVHVSPDMIDSFIHRRGGPIFFALSLVPLLLAMLWLRRLEASSARPRVSRATA